MKILWLTWKDHRHPTAGGAEVVLAELSRRLVRDGHSVTWLTCGYGGAAAHETIDGVDIIRVGTNRFVHPWQALAYYVRRLRNRFDIVIEVVNTAAYFSVFFGKGSRRFLFYHQLAGEVWSYETPAPVSHFGRFIYEPFSTRTLARTGVPAITVSESTRRDLARFGFRPERTHIISEGTHLQPVQNLDDIEKFPRPTMLSLGAMRAMKRTLDQIAAFELAKQDLPDLQLKISGLADGAYGQKVLDRIKQSPFAADIEYLGRTSDSAKTELMQRSHVIAVTSIKEGWGLIVTEAASQGTPAVVYDVDGLRDSVRDGKTGYVTDTNPRALSRAIVRLLTDGDRYARMREDAWRWSKQFTFDQSYQDFKKVLQLQ
jgi:glycosyltransferase involved in cell wall biosynthesis